MITKPIFRQSFRVLFDRLKPNEEFKKVFTKKMHRILGPLALTYSTDKIPTLDEAYALLGRVHAQLVAIKELADFLQRYSGSSLPQWPQELWDLKESVTKQVDICERLVLGLLQQQEKLNG